MTARGAAPGFAPGDMGAVIRRPRPTAGALTSGARCSCRCAPARGRPQCGVNVIRPQHRWTSYGPAALRRNRRHNLGSNRAGRRNRRRRAARRLGDRDALRRRMRGHGYHFVAVERSRHSSARARWNARLRNKNHGCDHSGGTAMQEPRHPKTPRHPAMCDPLLARVKAIPAAAPALECAPSRPPDRFPANFTMPVCWHDWVLQQQRV